MPVKDCLMATIIPVDKPATAAFGMHLGRTLVRMRVILLAFIQLVMFRFRKRSSLQFEVIALRHQIAILKRRQQQRHQQPLITPIDRLIWSCFYSIYPRAIKWMQVVKPKTVVEWHRRGFLFYWRRRFAGDSASERDKEQLSRLILQLYSENSGWGLARIRAELLKLGYDVDTGSVARSLMGKFNKYRMAGDPAWKKFLRNHMRDSAAMDMFVVVTLSFRLLYAVVIISHDRRRILHIDATEHPTQDWLTQTVSQAFTKNPRPKYLVRDRDNCYGRKFSQRLKKLGIREHVIPRQSPWANPFVERLIGSIRRECLNHVVIVNENHLRRILGEYVDYYNRWRTHMSIAKDCPIHRPKQSVLEGSQIVTIPHVGGLHHHYEWEVNTSNPRKPRGNARASDLLVNMPEDWGQKGS
jgi:transposase InsO family protein